MLVSELHAELMHYTSLDGLKGIIESDCLWATDASFLNDSSEIAHYFDTRLEVLVSSEERQFAIEQPRDPAELARMIRDGGFDASIALEARESTAVIRRATLSTNRPFVLSLSGPSDQRVKQSGLLSQWRGYGGDGGYALVFDTAKLESILHREAESHRYSRIFVGQVYYHDIDPDLQPHATSEVAESEVTVKQGVARLLRGGTADETEGFYDAVTALSCLCKHWGFWEEREVRVVLLPATEEDTDVAAESALPTKEIKTFLRGETEVPYVELFAHLADRAARRNLPIRRVIVGPHRDSSARAKAVRKLLLDRGIKLKLSNRKSRISADEEGWHASFTMQTPCLISIRGTRRANAGMHPNYV
jgi:hypothetical protein